MRTFVNGKQVLSVEPGDTAEDILRKSDNDGDYVLMNVRTHEIVRGSEVPELDEENWFRVYHPPKIIGGGSSVGGSGYG